MVYSITHSTAGSKCRRIVILVDLVICLYLMAVAIGTLVWNLTAYKDTSHVA